MSVNLKLEKAKLIEKIESIENLSSVDINSLNLILNDLIAGKIFIQSPIMEKKVIDKPKIKKQPIVWGKQYSDKFKEVEKIKEELGEINVQLFEKLKILKGSKEEKDKIDLEIEKANKLIAELKKGL